MPDQSKLIGIRRGPVLFHAYKSVDWFGLWFIIKRVTIEMLINSSHLIGSFTHSKIMSPVLGKLAWRWRGILKSERHIEFGKLRKKTTKLTIMATSYKTLLFLFGFILMSPLSQGRDRKFKKSTTVGYMPGPFLSQKIERSMLSCAKSCAPWAHGISAFNFETSNKRCELSQNGYKEGLNSNGKAGVRHMVLQTVGK